VGVDSGSEAGTTGRDSCNDSSFNGKNGATPTFPVVKTRRILYNFRVTAVFSFH